MIQCLPRGPRRASAPRCWCRTRAHGTNPASAALCGFKVVEVKSAPDGRVSLRRPGGQARSPDVAALMLTNPNTVGTFEQEILEIAGLVHAAGRQALLRRRQPQRLHGHLPARRHGLRRRAHEPAQDLHHAPWRRRPRRRPGRRQGGAGARSCRRPPSATAERPLRARLRPAQVDRPGAQLLRQLRHAGPRATPTSWRWAATA